MTSELPAYHHLTPQQVEGLSIRVTLRCGKEGSCLSKDFAWQERVTRPSPTDAASPDDASGACLFTYTNADVVPDSGEGLGFRFRGDDDSRGRPLRAEREDARQIMVIAAADTNDSALEPHVQVLCVIKLHESGQLSACPGFSEVEPEDDCDGRVFASDRGLDEARVLGPRLTTYAFCTVAEYAIECNAVGGDDRGEADLLATEKHEERRRRIRKEFEAFDCMHEDEDAQWDAHARVELVSADGFEESNPLLCAPFGSGLVVRYRVLRSRSVDGSEEEVVLLKGTTACVQSHSTVRGTLEFATRFTVAFVVLAFVLLLWLGEGGCDFWRTLLLSSVPLALIVKAAVLGNASRFHINHHFGVNNHTEKPSAHSPEEMVLELRAFFRHNFGVTSLAGCGVVALPSNPGTYDVIVPTWKPIACSGVSEARCRLHSYYLGSCLSEVHPLDPVPASESEGELLQGTDATLLSKGGLTTDGAGSIQVRLDVTKNYFLRDTPSGEAQEETRQHRVKLNETVDEVIRRVRRNKRGRMARVYDAAASDDASATGGGTPERAMDRERDETKGDKVSERTAEVLTRVRARKHASTHDKR
ncbi:hypothetical protein ACHAXT_008425 [Thalassiosira profunda]